MVISWGVNPRVKMWQVSVSLFLNNNYTFTFFFPMSQNFGQIDIKMAHYGEDEPFLRWISKIFYSSVLLNKSDYIGRIKVSCVVSPCDPAVLSLRNDPPDFWDRYDFAFVSSISLNISHYYLHNFFLIAYSLKLPSKAKHALQWMI